MAGNAILEKTTNSRVVHRSRKLGSQKLRVFPFHGLFLVARVIDSWGGCGGRRLLYPARGSAALAGGNGAWDSSWLRGCKYHIMHRAEEVNGGCS